MSTVKNQTLNIDLSESEFPCLGTKETTRAAKGKRHAAEALLRRQLATRATITKTLEDPNNLLGKRRKARLGSEMADSMAFGVQYSLNRKGRWQTADAQHLLAGPHPKGIDVGVVEKALTGRKTLATTVHCLNNDGSISSAHTSKTPSNNQSQKDEANNQKRKNGKSARNSKDVEHEEIDNARIAYNILKLHPNTATFRKLFYKENCRKGRRAGSFRVECDDIATASEMEASIHDDTNTYKPSRDFRFCLADYMEQPKEMVLARKKSIAEITDEHEVPSESDIVHVDVCARPGNLLNISAIVRTNAFFDSIVVSTQEWDGFVFSEQVDELGEPYVIRWIDANRKRVAIDASKVLLHERENYDRQLLIIVLEKMRKNNIRVVVNSVFSSPPAFNLSLVHSKIQSINARTLKVIMESVCEIVKQWKADHPILTFPDTSTRFESHRTAFEPNVNSVLLANSATVIDQLKMAELLRKEEEYVIDTFERLSSDDWSEADDELDIELVETEKEILEMQKCISCSCANPDELFEMDEWWQCRECLRQLIITQIRMKNIPFHIPLVCHDGQSPFDVLPSLLPLPLIAFYTKLAATEVLSESSDEIGDLTECPGCKQTAHVLRPNDFNSCFCSVCGVHWCVGCRFEPHFPLTCDQYALWVEKFSKQFDSDSMREETETFIKKIVCDCGEVIKCGDKAVKAKCRQCCLDFNPQTMKLTSDHERRPSKFTHKLRTAKTQFYFDRIEFITPAKLINKHVSEVCTQARMLRFSESKTNDFERKIRKAKENTVNAEKLKELRKASLCLIENGFAWLYINRNCGNLSASKAALSALQKQLEEITYALDNNIKNDLHGKVNAFDAAFHKTIEAIRKAI